MKPLHIIASLLILGILALAGMEFVCTLGIKCKNCSQASESKEMSIEDGFYLGEYEPLTQKIKLKNHELEVAFSTAWYEKDWFINSDLCIRRHKEAREGLYNLILPFEKSKEKVRLFSMKPVIDGKEEPGGGAINESQWHMKSLALPDTIEIQIREKSPVAGIGWSEGGVLGAKVRYVRK